MCFASSIDQENVNEKIVNRIEPWAKIIRVIQVATAIMFSMSYAMTSSDTLTRLGLAFSSKV